MYGYIYLTTNLINGKIYIGQHKSSTYDPRYIGSGRDITKAIEEFGTLNFSNVLLEKCDSFEELNKKEKEYIAKYDSTNPSVGYNLTKGGQGFDGYSFTEEDRKKIGIKSRINNLNRDPEIYQQISEQHKGSRFMYKDDWQGWVYKDEIDTYLQNGYQFGSLRKRNGTYLKGKDSPYYGKTKEGFTTKGKIAVHKGSVRTFIDPSKLDEYIQLGYSIGLKDDKDKRPENRTDYYKRKYLMKYP